MDIVKLYRQTVASKKLGTGTSVTKAKYVAGRSGRVAVLRTKHCSGLEITEYSTGMARGSRFKMQRHGQDRAHALTGQQFRTVWVQAKNVCTATVLGPYSAAKQREASYG